jgi:hypothetical protein
VKSKKIIKIFIFLQLLFSFSIQAELMGFCFDQGVSLNSVKGYLSPILAPQDKVFKRESVNCLEIEMDNNRVPLFETYLTRRFRLTRQYAGNSGAPAKTSSNITSLEHCRFQLKKVSNEKRKKDLYKIQKGGALRQRVTTGEGERVSQLLLGLGRKGSLSIAGEKMDLLCIKRGVGYEVDFYLISAGGNQVSTSLSITIGQELNIGSVFEDLKRKTREIDISKGIVIEKEKGGINHDYFLKLLPKN